MHLYYYFTIYMYSKQMASCVISYCFPSDGKEKELKPFEYGKNQYLQKLTQVNI